MNDLAVALHADWLSDAAARIRQPRLRESFANDARMRVRVAARGQPVKFRSTSKRSAALIRD